MALALVWKTVVLAHALGMMRLLPVFSSSLFFYWQPAAISDACWAPCCWLGTLPSPFPPFNPCSCGAWHLRASWTSSFLAPAWATKYLRPCSAEPFFSCSHIYLSLIINSILLRGSWPGGKESTMEDWEPRRAGFEFSPDLLSL